MPKPPPLEVTKHRVHACECARCGSRTGAEFPEGVGAPVQYCPNFGALVAYLSVAQLIPLKRVCQILRSVHGLLLSEGTAHPIIRRSAAGLRRCRGTGRAISSSLTCTVPASICVVNWQINKNVLAFWIRT